RSPPPTARRVARARPPPPRGTPGRVGRAADLQAPRRAARARRSARGCRGEPRRARRRECPSRRRTPPRRAAARSPPAWSPARDRPRRCRSPERSSLVILVLGGTAEARALAGALDEAGVPVISALPGRLSNPRRPAGRLRDAG